MNSKKLESWANQLLDTGKGNNLINFKDTKASTVEILLPNVEGLFAKAESSASFEVYDPKIADEDDLAEWAGPEESAASDVGKLDREDYLTVYSRKIRKSNQILLFNPAVSPITALKNIDKKANTAIEETGVNVAYIAFGFIHWKEKEGTREELQAPILLSPVVFSRESAIEPYYVHMTQDEVIVNPTFDYKLNAEQGINLPPYQDEGLGEYLSKVEKMVSKLGWTVSSECKIGIFSFLKVNMYQDLMNHQDAILQNNNVRMLLGESFENQKISIESGEHRVENPLVELHSVVDADSSQIEAIEMAKAGVSFVLQGPPGTGKSQTITNIIAECLSDGKKVLFVSEKLAALNVVYDKLKKAGLEEFCLELHSYKANKKDVIDNLCRTLRMPKSQVSARADGEIRQKLQAQQELDNYEVELHLEREPIGKSLYQMYEEYAGCRNIPDTGIFIDDIGSKGDEYLTEAMNLLSQYADYVPSTGYDYRNNCWYGYINPDTSYTTRKLVSQHMQVLAETLEDILVIADQVSADYGVNCRTLKDVSLWHDFFSAAADSRYMTPSFLQKAAFSYLSDKIGTLKEQALQVRKLRTQITADYTDSVFDLDAGNYHSKLQTQFAGLFSRLFNGEYKQIIANLAQSSKNSKKPSYTEALAITETLAQYHRGLLAFEQEEAPIRSGMGPSYQGVDTDWDALAGEIGGMKLFYDSGTAFGRISTMANDAFEKEKVKFGTDSANLKELLGKCKEASAFLAASFDASIFDVENTSMTELIGKLDDCMNHIGIIDNWCALCNLLHRIDKVGLTSFLNQAIDKKIPASDFGEAYRKTFYFYWIDFVIHGTPELAMFSRISHDKAVQVFRAKDETQFTINKVKIRSELSAQRPSLEMMSSGSAVSILLREGEKKRKQKSIRNLLAETGELVQTIKPCFLMSPLSVSTFLDSDAIRFDTVVFDEASQIFPQDAIGAIYRGTQLIVVGDSRQMPPSNFFTSSIEAESDEESGDVTDFESILDLCSTALPQLRLKWHYRSRFEQLIAFSNKNFYDNELITFPSASLDTDGVGVDFYYAGGQFDHRSKNNRVEAEFIVDLIYQNIEKYPNRSLGVVAFSVAQQTLIEKLLSRKRQEDPSKEFFFKANAAEPFFIKNLETVQGDERDTIIFSVAYAKDSQGRLMHNFGPLNRVGGERRLNVAVTRAKLNVQLVASIHHTDIDLKRTRAEGAKLLKEYLDYAENGSIALERTMKVDPYERFDSEFEAEVCDFLRSRGFSVDTQVGCSSFRIDLALKKPDSSDYVLAIECDGATYHSSKNARDRDRLRQEILESMGWKFYRIWSTEWFKNKDLEKKALLEKAAAAVSGAEEAGPDSQANSSVSDGSAVGFHGTGYRTDTTECGVPGLDESMSDEDVFDGAVFEEVAEEKKVEFPPYQMLDVEKICRYEYDFQKIVRQVLEAEAPLSEEWFLKRSCSYFNRSKVTNVVTQEYNRKMYGCEKNGIIRRDGFLYLEGRTDYQLRIPNCEAKRDIKYIANEELAAGIYQVVKQNVNADKDGVYRYLANQLGFSRIGENIYEKMDEALAMLLENVITLQENMLSLKK